MTERHLRRHWSDAACKLLVGRTITSARYTEEEGVVFFEITLDDGTILVPMSDDECNDTGSLSIFGHPGIKCFPHLR